MLARNLLRFSYSPRYFTRYVIRRTLHRAPVMANASTIHGSVSPAFTSVAEIFRENFEKELESAGAAFAAYYKGELVVDLWGGYADVESGRLWEEDTITHIFSVTKALSALCLAKLIDEGKANYDDIVSSYWPEFACNGKANTTIRHIVQHQAGLTYGPHAVTVSDVLDHRKMSKIFEEMVPLWEPGTATGYHTLTIGFLIDQLVRRIDNEARGVVDYFEQEILDKLGVEEIFIGLPNSKLNKRTTKITLPTAEDISKEGERNPEALKRYTLSNNSHQDKLYEMWPWIQLPDYNKLENRLLRMPSNMGISTARDIAHLHYLLIDGKILSKRFLNLMSKPVLVDEFDIVNGYKENKGLGWQYTRNPKGKWIFGHSGTGGQNMRVDVDSKLAYAYFCNGLKIADSDNVESFSRLQTALYSCIK